MHKDYEEDGTIISIRSLYNVTKIQSHLKNKKVIQS